MAEMRDGVDFYPLLVLLAQNFEFWKGLWLLKTVSENKVGIGVPRKNLVGNKMLQ